jgi:hypothetical protein
MPQILLGWIKVLEGIIARQGMMIFLVSFPDQEKDKILASFAPLRFNISSFFLT